MKQKVINFFLKKLAENQENSALKTFAGESILITIENGLFNVYFKINELGHLENIESVEKVSTTLSMTIKAILNLLVKPTQKKLKIEGNIDLAKAFDQYINTIDFNAEIKLADLIGYKSARLLTLAGKSIFKKTLKRKRNIEETIIEYYQEEKMLLAKERQVAKFNQAVDKINLDVEKIITRVSQLKK